MESPIELSLHFLSKGAKMTSYKLSRVPVKPLYNTSIRILISLLSMLYVQKVQSAESEKYIDR